MNKRDLFVVVPDLDAENTLATLLCDRQQALGIALDFEPIRPPQGDLLRYAGRDSGCYKAAVNLLRPPQRTHRHAILCFDRHGCGADESPRTEIEGKIEEQLQRIGWDEGTVAVIVFDPELEAWVWSDSPHVATTLGWEGDGNTLQSFLESEGLWAPFSAKPDDPKEAMRRVLKERRQPGTAQLFNELARRVSLQRCQDPAFSKFKRTLRSWFGT